jgi:hypothetical protein
MYVLSFRDMSTPRCGAVTTAAMYTIPSMNAAMNWFPPPKMTLVPWQKISGALAGKHVCFLVHGFNVNRDDGYMCLGAFGQEMTKVGELSQLAPPTGPLNLLVPGIDIVVPVLWAGDWYLPVNYPFLLPDVRLTGKYFADLIASSATQMARVSFVTHSMGARVVLETIQQAVSAAAKTGSRIPIFDTAIFTAPATSDQVLDDPNYADAVSAVQRFVVVSSRADMVLALDFPMGNLVEQALWPRDPGDDAALGRYGPQLKTNSKALTKTQWYEIPLASGQAIGSYDHGDYFPSPANIIAPYPNGWSDKCVKIGALSQAVLDRQAPSWPPLQPITPQ